MTLAPCAYISAERNEWAAGGNGRTGAGHRFTPGRGYSRGDYFFIGIVSDFFQQNGGGRKAQGIEEGAIKSLLDTGAETGGECHEQNRKIKRGITPEGCISF